VNYRRFFLLAVRFRLLHPPLFVTTDEEVGEEVAEVEEEEEEEEEEVANKDKKDSSHADKVSEIVPAEDLEVGDFVGDGVLDSIDFGDDIGSDFGGDFGVDALSESNVVSDFCGDSSVLDFGGDKADEAFCLSNVTLAGFSLSRKFDKDDLLLLVAGSIVSSG
jgi:hypothetical protein